MQGPVQKLKLTTEALRPLGESAQEGEDFITIILSFMYCSNDCGRTGNTDTSGYACSKVGYPV